MGAGTRLQMQSIHFVTHFSSCAFRWIEITTIIYRRRVLFYFSQRCRLRQIIFVSVVSRRFWKKKKIDYSMFGRTNERGKIKQTKARAKAPKTHLLFRFSLLSKSIPSPFLRKTMQFPIVSRSACSSAAQMQFKSLIVRYLRFCPSPKFSHFSPARSWCEKHWTRAYQVWVRREANIVDYGKENRLFVVTEEHAKRRFRIFIQRSTTSRRLPSEWRSP